MVTESNGGLYRTWHDILGHFNRDEEGLWWPLMIQVDEIREAAFVGTVQASFKAGEEAHTYRLIPLFLVFIGVC